MFAVSTVYEYNDVHMKRHLCFNTKLGGGGEEEEEEEEEEEKEDWEKEERGQK